MKLNSFSPFARTCALSGAGLLTAFVFTACDEQGSTTTVVYQDRPAPQTVVVQDDYVYYPEYQVYYSNSRHQYGYRDGNSWAWRPAPPHVSVNVLFSSPSVRMDFHDSPERHHDTVIRTYPKNWKPQPDKNHSDKDDHRDDQKDDHKDDRKDGDRKH